MAGRVVSWDEHTARNHANALYGSLRKQRLTAALQFRRLALGSASAFAGFLGLRLHPGRPRVRFEEGVCYAKEVIMKSEG